MTPNDSVHANTSNRYLGFFDMADVLSLMYGIDLLQHLFSPSKLREQLVDVHGWKLDLSDEKAVAKGGVTLPVSVLMQSQGRAAPWWPVAPTSSLLDVVKRLAAKVDQPWSPCRRVPVVDPKTGKVTKIISQSEMVSQVFHNVVDHKATEPLFIESPRTHKIGLCDVRCVNHNEMARKAFEIIINLRVSAVPVLGPEGGMIAVISNKDIPLLRKMQEAMETAAASVAPTAVASSGKKKKGGEKAVQATVAAVAAAPIAPDQMTALQFVEAARNLATESGSKRQEPISVSLDYPIHLIIKTLAEMKTHRVFVIDDMKKKPVGVVSVSDIVKLILDEELPWPTAVVMEKVGGHGSN